MWGDAGRMFRTSAVRARKATLVAVCAAVVAALVTSAASTQTLSTPAQFATLRSGQVSGVAVDYVSDGGWLVTWNAVADAANYEVAVNGRQVTTTESTAARVEDRAGYDPTMSPFPVVTVTPHLRTGVSGAGTDQYACTPFTFMSARGSGQNSPTTGWEDGLGDRGMRVSNSIRSTLNVGQSFVSVYAVNYPATRVDTVDGLLQYEQSVAAGVTGLTAQTDAVLRACPRTRILWFGYSQGADVVASAWQSSLTPLERSAIVRVSLFGDPRFNPQDTSVAPSAQNATFRGPLGARDPFNSNKVVSWCAETDVVCQGSPTNIRDIQGHVHGPVYDTFERMEATSAALAITDAFAAKPVSLHAGTPDGPATQP